MMTDDSLDDVQPAYVMPRDRGKTSYVRLPLIVHCATGATSIRAMTEDEAHRLASQANTRATDAR